MSEIHIQQYPLEVSPTRSRRQFFEVFAKDQEGALLGHAVCNCSLEEWVNPWMDDTLCVNNLSSRHGYNKGYIGRILGQQEMELYRISPSPKTEPRNVGAQIIQWILRNRLPHITHVNIPISRLALSELQWYYAHVCQQLLEKKEILNYSSGSEDCMCLVLPPKSE